MTHSLRDLRIADLQLFITAARLKNLGQAATLHHLSQSAASAAILRVESAFGQPLCEHERRQFRLTEEGRSILPRAEAWLKILMESVVSKDPLPLRLVTTHALARVSLPAVWAIEFVDLQLLRPDSAYSAVLRDEADVALVLDNANWEGVAKAEVGQGFFQLYSREKNAVKGPMLIPEDQIEVLILQQRWREQYGEPLPIKARLRSWSLIADLCAESSEIGFLPDFLGRQCHLQAVPWQPAPSSYRVLALYRHASEPFLKRLQPLLAAWRSCFGH
ncbi:MAG: LysR family transcriptional regulator [Verrucomicrobia bacterium]|nr:LysR family transcriptional regulator [Verrucomicrobiota bacterium]